MDFKEKVLTVIFNSNTVDSNQGLLPLNWGKKIAIFTLHKTSGAYKTQIWPATIKYGKVISYCTF